MDPEPRPLDLAFQLPRDAYWQLVHTLRGALPPPASDAPEDLVRRDNAAIAEVACLLPANAAEANLAAQHVAAHARAMECLQIAHDPATSRELAVKCHAQSASMMRHSQGALRLLLRLQAVRHKIEADGVTANRAEWTEHCALGLMAQALPGPPRAPMAEPPPPPEPGPEPEPEPEPLHEATPDLDPVAAAEEYALIHPQRAALIRRTGGAPDRLPFERPEEFLVRELVTGRTPALLALDREFAPPRAA